MFGLFKLFDATGFPPRWMCGTGWTSTLGWTHIVADLAISLAYFAVPCITLWFVARQPEIKLPRSFWILLTLIFVSCGFVHLFESVIFWWPVYRLSAALKVLTAVVSCSGVVLLVRVLPTALSLKHPDELNRVIAERKRTEAMLHEETFLLNTLLDQLPDAIYFKDVGGKFIRVSRSLSKRLGLASADEAVGRDDSEFFPADYAERSREDERALMESHEPVVGKEQKPRWPDGSETWVSTTKCPLVSPDGRLLGTMGISHDVTELKRKEEALRESEERYELAVRGSTDGIWDWNVRTDAVYYSPRFKELLGFAEDEFPDRFESFESRLHPDDRKRTLKALRDHLDEGTAYDIEYRLLTKDDVYRWFRARGQAVWDDDGTPSRMAGSITDVTQRRQAEERFRLAVEASPSGMLIVDEAGNILLANTQIEQLFGYTRDQLAEITVEDLVPSSVRGDHPRLRSDYFANPHHRPMGAGRELTARRRDGEEFDVEIGLSPLRSESGTTVLCSVLDVTERRRNLRELEAAKEAAEEANRAKSDFLATMSHEIRTPMNAIIGMTELVLDTELSPSQRDYLATVSDSADSLLTIINEVLDFSKIEAGQIVLEEVPFSLRDVLGDALKAMGLRAHARGLELAWHVASTVPDDFVGDPTRLRQIVVNLVGNAIKFTHEGEVVLDVTHVVVVDDELELHVEVRDTGVGIPEEKRQAIFDAFTQADMSTTREFGGTGLGLSISARLVDLMDGRIGVESEVGVGSRFSFSVRLGRGSAEPSAVVERPRLQGLPVLVVDDNATNRRILEEMLRGWGMAVTTVESAATALVALTETTEPIRLVVTDLHMPEMDGFELIERLRGTPEHADVVVILLTSGHRPSDSERCASLDVAALLTKPAKQSELLEAISTSLLRRTVTANASPEERPPEPRVEALDVLLAEDNLANQKLAAGLLKRWGHRVEVAGNGVEALAMLEAGSFDLVLMDVNMPEMDGLEATREIRRRERQSGTRIPIVAMTAHAMKGDRERCLESGMDAYLAKPIRQREFAALLASLFGS